MMSVEIPRDYVPAVEKLISEGRFGNEAEVVAEGLRLIVMRDNLHADIQAGLNDLDAGNRIDAGEVYAEARRRIESLENEAGQ